MYVDHTWANIDISSFPNRIHTFFAPQQRFLRLALGLVCLPSWRVSLYDQAVARLFGVLHTSSCQTITEFSLP